MPKKKRKVGLTILASVIISALIIAFVNLGLALDQVEEALGKPDWDDYWDANTKNRLSHITDEQDCEDAGGVWSQGMRGYKDDVLVVDEKWCDDSELTRQEYQDAKSKFSMKVFFILAGIGFVLLMVGMFVPIMAVQIIGMATGGVLVIEAVIRYWENQIVAFVTLGLIIAVAIWFAIKKLK